MRDNSEILDNLVNSSNALCLCADFSALYPFKKGCAFMGKEIYNIINDMAEVLNAS